MFRFDFGEENTKQKQEQEVVLPNRLDAKKITVLNQEEFSIEGGTMFINSFPLFKRTLPDINFEIAQTDDMETENELIEAINSSSDIIRGVYEGGIKTWECSIDLVRYLQSMSDDINGKRILEIGCGSALPGLFCIRVGGVVDFQDYNESVLGLVTIPNIALNTTHMPSQVEMDGQFEVNVKYNLEKMNKYQYFSGDWFHLANLFENLPKYDIILTSETIYEAENTPSLCKLINTCLKDDGVAYVAAKHNYFGCSGSIEGFKSICTNQEFQFNLETVFEHSEGVRREIIKLTKQR